jgi:hypothetical protein
MAKIRQGLNGHYCLSNLLASIRPSFRTSSSRGISNAGPSEEREGYRAVKKGNRSEPKHFRLRLGTNSFPS